MKPASLMHMLPDSRHDNLQAESRQTRAKMCPIRQTSNATEIFRSFPVLRQRYASWCFSVIKSKHPDTPTVPKKGSEAYYAVSVSNYSFSQLWYFYLPETMNSVFTKFIYF